MGIIKRVTLLFFGTNLTRQYERIEEAIKNQAHLESEMCYKNMMANFYTERLLDIDHNTDWHGFANEKQKQYDCQMEYGKYQKQADEARTKVEALKLSLKVLQKADNETV